MQAYPLAVLIDELKHKDFQVRLNAVKRVSQIALALGEERTRTELVRFLQESLEDEDEVLQTLAEELGEFIPLIGGVEYAHHLVSLLETLAKEEETIVRGKAVASFKKICTQMVEGGIREFHENFFKIVKSLAEGVWFTSRVSACDLFTPVYPYVDAEKQNVLRSLFTKLCTDETPMVKRSAAQNLGGFGKVVGTDVLKKHMLPLFEELAKDEQDSVRLLSVDACVDIAGELSAEEKETFILRTLHAYFTDGSWRVRYQVADRFTKLQAALGPVVSSKFLVGQYIGLLKDPEAEVRSVAISKLPEYAGLLTSAEKDSTIVDKVVPAVDDLAKDSNQNVRASLARVIMSLSSTLGKENTMNILLPFFLQLLRDPCAEVRLNIISKLDCVNEVIGLDILKQSLLPAIIELAQDKEWRVRLAIIEYMPLLAEQLGVAFFDDKLSKICMTWLEDNVYSIREAATQNLKQLTDNFGADWALERIVPMIITMCEHQNYLYRMTSLFAIIALVQVSEGLVLTNKLAPTVLNMVGDSVPNVRFNVAITLGKMSLIADAAHFELHLKPALETLSRDSDFDVRFFAIKARKAMEEQE